MGIKIFEEYSHKTVIGCLVNSGLTKAAMKFRENI